MSNNIKNIRQKIGWSISNFADMCLELFEGYSWLLFGVVSVILIILGFFFIPDNRFSLWEKIIFLLIVAPVCSWMMSIPFLLLVGIIDGVGVTIADPKKAFRNIASGVVHILEIAVVLTIIFVIIIGLLTMLDMFF